jgi:membrane-bound lytic murein transglycosylase MltF
MNETTFNVLTKIIEEKDYELRRIIERIRQSEMSILNYTQEKAKLENEIKDLKEAIQ